MLGTLIIVLLIASIFALSAGFLVAALRLGKNFARLGDQSTQGQSNKRKTTVRR